MTKTLVRGKHVTASFVTIVIIFVFTLAGFAYLLNDDRELSRKTAYLAVENSHRITEIQKSRVFSCQKTYNGVRDVFDPFYPEPDATPSQKAIHRRFEARIDDLVAGCAKQTKPHK